MRNDLDTEVSAARQGDAAAWERIFRVVFPAVWAYVARRVKTGIADVEDIVQETMLRIVRWMPTATVRGGFLAWCIGIARQCVAAFYRRAGRAGPDAGDVVALLCEENPPDARLLRAEVVDTVGGALGALPAHYRQALRLKYVEDLPFSALAERMERTESAVKTLVMRAKDALRRELGRETAGE
jgi:RNA polymerase sigma-70 factor (ECF subfamily)